MLAPLGLLASASGLLVPPNVANPPAIVQQAAARASSVDATSLLAQAALFGDQDSLASLLDTSKLASSKLAVPELPPAVGETLKGVAPALEKTLKDAAPVLEYTLKQEVAPAVTKAATDLAPIAKETVDTLTPPLTEFVKAAAREIWSVILLPAAQITADATSEAAGAAASIAQVQANAAIGQAGVKLGEAGAELANQASSQGLAIEPETLTVLQQAVDAFVTAVAPILAEALEFSKPLVIEAWQVRAPSSLRLQSLLPSHAHCLCVCHAADAHPRCSGGSVSSGRLARGGAGRGRSRCRWR